MIKELEYRTFDELLDSVKLDFETYDIENMISNQTLIKIAQKINKELGLKLNPSKTKILDLRKGKAKLPSDLYVLNFALRCGEEYSYEIMNFPQAYGTYQQGVEEGTRQATVDLLARMVKQYTVVMDIEPGSNVVTHNLGTTNVVIQAVGPTGNILTFDVNITNSNQIRIISESDVTQSNIKVIVLGSNSSYGVYCPPPGTLACPAEPEIISVENTTSCPTLTCNTSGCDTVAYTDNNNYKKYNVLYQFRLLDNKSTTVDEFNMTSLHNDMATVKNGYLVTNLDEATVLINYQGQMEDEDGNLLVLDDPLVNEYYEYALKKRICENLIANGEQVINLYNLINNELRKAKIDAHHYVRTPGFKTLLKTWRMNRQAMHVKYYNAFKS
ncbi:MAG: hypothetical protein EOL97_14005 [Spirochaetia bacterium]|nr:hypothetical protein [Spirochaetia bacterium]